MNPTAHQRPPRGPVLWCVLSAVFFGASTPASKPLLNSLSPLVLSGLLYIGAAIAVAPWALRGWRFRGSARARNTLRLVGAIVFGGILGPVLLLSGLAMASAGSVALWLNLETVATAILARLFFKEHMNRSTWIAVVLIVAASALLSPGTPHGGAAVLLVALAAIAWGLDNNFTSIIDGYSPAQITFAKGIVAGSVNVGLGLAFTESTFSAGVLSSALLVGAVSYGASLLLYIAGAQHLGATRSQLIFSTAPAWGLGLAWVVLGEQVQTEQLAAAVMMAGAIWLWYREQHSHKHAHTRMTHKHWHRHDDGHHDHEHPEPVLPDAWHSHEHTHAPMEHEHPHRPDLHHRHDH